MPTLLGSVGSARSFGSPTSLSYSQAVGAGTNRQLVVALSGLGLGSPAVTSTVTWNGFVTLTKGGDGNLFAGNGNYLLAEFYSAADAALSVATGTVLITPSRTCYSLLSGAGVWTGADQATPFGTTVGSGENALAATTTSSTVSTVAGQTVIGVCAMYAGSAYTLSASDTVLYSFDQDPSDGIGGGSQYAVAAGSSKTLTWTMSFADDHAWSAATTLNDVVIVPPLTPRPGGLGLRTARGGLIPRLVRSKWAQDVPVQAVTGTLARTSANDTSAAQGTTTVTGTLARTNANDTSAASGSPVVSGTVAKTNANDTASASGSPIVSGSVARTNANDTSAATGTTTVTGSSARTNANDAISASGTTTVVGSSAKTNANDTAAAFGGGIVSGTLATTNANDAASASGTTTVLGSAAAQGGNDTASASGDVGSAPVGPVPAGRGRRVAVERNGRIELFEDEKELEQFLAPEVVPPPKTKPQKVKVVTPDVPTAFAPLAVAAPQTRTFDPMRPNRKVRRAELRQDDDEEALLVLLL